MQQTLLSFVQADIEIGQTKSGLTESSDSFLTHLHRRQKSPFKPTLAFDLIGKTEQHLSDKLAKFYNEQDLNAFSFSIYQHLADLSFRGLSKNRINVNFGGDHSLSMATVEASLRHNPNTLVIWIDAHADLNSAEESLSGNLHGMPVYYLMQKPENRPASLHWMKNHLPSENIVYFGVRDLDHFEREYLESKKIMHFTVHDIRTQGLTFCLSQLAKKMSQFENVHVSFDIDCLDTNYALCTGVPVNNGLELSEIYSLAQLVASSGKLKNLDMVEINPRLAKSALELNETFEIALQFIQQITEGKSEYASVYPTDSARA
ncbi:arginase family protein [Pseudobdellovibrio sp. HCB154]|uniref:arginase family protein n=1 Tax=Pseudobdellovibrio sp. HCB154 TaxID=3386277 RepID=UPI003916CCEE